MTKIPYTKPALTYEEQLEKLKSNGLEIPDPENAKKVLQSVSYYRLSGYWYPFRQTKNTEGMRQISNTFKPCTSFDDILWLYEFDQEIRTLILCAIEQIEVAVRTQFTYCVSHRHGAFGYVEAKNFRDQSTHAVWFEKLKKEIERSQDSPSIRHYKEKYSEYPQIPIWLMTEVISFGCLSQGFKVLRDDPKNGYTEKQEISNFFHLKPKQLESWLHTLTFVRNVCAHHGRLWNRKLAICPSAKDHILFPNTTKANAKTIPLQNDRIFCVLLMIQHMLQPIKVGHFWKEELHRLLRSICTKPQWQADAMGIPSDWEQHQLWN